MLWSKLWTEVGYALCGTDKQVTVLCQDIYDPAKQAAPVLCVEINGDIPAEDDIEST